MGNSGLDSVILACGSVALPFGSPVSVVSAITCFGDSLAIRKESKKGAFMAEAADQTQHEFWRAPMLASKAVAKRGRSDERSATCRCGTEFIVSSQYCHVCGASRPDLSVSVARTPSIPGLAELALLGERLGLTTPATIAFLVGVLCGVGALSVSVFFSARTVLDWQAIQLWRIEWLLAAVAAFVAGCLLKK
jgi:hypothetical protein